MESLNEIKQLGESLGYEGSQLREFIKDQQDIMREERLAVRQKEKDDQEYKLELEKVSLEKTKAEKRYEMEKEKMVSEFKMKEMEQMHEKEILETQVKVKSVTEKVSVPKGPKLPPFEEEKDDIDSYLRRFELYAASQKWSYDVWATHLSALLKGKALDVYALLPKEKALDFNELKNALLQRFHQTEEGFKKKFRAARPEDGETFTQFGVRLSSYLTRWIDMSQVDRTYEGLFDLMVRDQFIHGCQRDLKLFINERTPKSLKEMTTGADQFREARDCSASSLTNVRNNSQLEMTNFVAKAGKNGFNIKERKHCLVCGKLNHLASECWFRKRREGSIERNRDRTDYNTGYRRQAYYRDNQVSTDRYTPNVCGACTTVNNIHVQATKKLEPELSQSCKSNFSTKMPVKTGVLNGQKITVLRDTGCSKAVVRTGLVKQEQMTGETESCVLADGTKIEVPVALIEIETPYYDGKVRAWCMMNPTYDVLIGNIDGAKDPNYNEEEEGKVQAVETRSRALNKVGDYKQLHVPEQIEDVTPADIQKAQEEDETLAKVREYAKSEKTIQRKNNQVTYKYKAGQLFRVFEPKRANRVDRKCLQLVVPQQYRKMVLKLGHESIMAGHMGTRKTIDRILRDFFWPGIHSDTKKYCSSCDICQKTMQKGRIGKVPLGKLPVIDVPFQRVAVDLVGPLFPATDRGNRYILTLVDYATRYPEAIALKNIDTVTVAEALIEIFSRIGFPQEMLTDMGSQFTSSLMSEVCRLISLKQLTTTVYHPMCNGLVEKFNGTMKHMLKKVCADRPKDWDKYLSPILFAYREVPQDSLGFSPFDLVYGRTVRGPM